jgi:S-adenosylmethionine synthetase
MGHPDKVADQISDAVLDAMLAQDPHSRVACETMVSTGMAIVAGEVRTEAYVEIPDIVRGVIEEIGYTTGDMAFDFVSCAVLSSIKNQSLDIAQGVDEGSKGEEGAGDQGMMFGFACNETPELMPLPIQLAHRLVEKQAEVRTSGAIKGLRPDAKSQVTVEYDEHGKPDRVDTVVMSTQHTPEWNDKQAELKQQVIEHIFKPVLGEKWHDGIKVHVNPTGKFELGGPHGDVGLTGRKIIVDTYGGRGRHGGGAFSGKDSTKVDRSAAYMARYIAKNIVAAKLADICEIQLSYAIGVPEPTSVRVETFGTGEVSEEKLSEAIREVFKLTPRGIIESLGLRNPIFRPTARHGHFGREPGKITVQVGNPSEPREETFETFSWEKTDKVEALKAALEGTAVATA